MADDQAGPPPTAAGDKTKASPAASAVDDARTVDLAREGRCARTEEQSQRNDLSGSLFELSALLEAELLRPQNLRDAALHINSSTSYHPGAAPCGFFINRLQFLILQTVSRRATTARHV